jgi:hypothetical protein
MTATTTDGAAIVTSGGGFVRWNIDRTEWLLRNAPQVIQWAAQSSSRDSILASLRSAGFVVRQIGGSGEFLGQCVNARGVSTDTPLWFFEARSS